MKQSRPKTFHYTNPEMAKYLLSKTPFRKMDVILDAGSGKNKVWYNNLPTINKYECEIDDGCDFFEWGKMGKNKNVDWVVGNPPFDLQKQFLEKASEIALKGIAFLGNINFWNGLTPKRRQALQEKGFYLQKIIIVQDKRWFGRYYYYLIFTKEKNNFIEWNGKTY